MQRTQEILRASLIYRFFVSAAGFLSSQWNNSSLMGAFLRPKLETASVSGVFGRLFSSLRRFETRVFRTLRLDRLLRGSIFSYPWLWCCALTALAPLIPTMAALGLSLAAAASVFIRLGIDAEYNIPAHPANRFVLLYAVASAAGTLFSISLRDSLFGGALLSFFAFFAVAAQYSLASRREVYRACAFLVGGGFLVSCIGMFQYIAGVSGASAWLDAEMFKGMTRVYSTLGNPNVLAEYLLLVIPFAAAGTLTAKRLSSRLAFAASLCAMLLCMALTLARGGWLGLIFAAAVFLVMMDRRFILLGIAGLVALYFLLPDVLLERFMSIGNLKDGSTSYRVYIWMGSLAMLRDYWFVGIGPGAAAFNKIYPIYAYGAIYAPHSHNLFLQIVCDAGITAAALFVMMLFSLLRSLARGTNRTVDKTVRIYRIAAISAVAGFLLQGMTDYSFYNYRVALVFWLTAGLAAALSRKEFDTADNA